MLIKNRPDRMQCTDNAQSVRIQCGRNLDNFRMASKASPHLDPITGHREPPLSRARAVATPDQAQGFAQPLGVHQALENLDRPVGHGVRRARESRRGWSGEVAACESYAFPESFPEKSWR